MDIANKYCFYVATARGALERTYCKPDEKKLDYCIGEKSEITALEWGRSEDEIVVGYKSGLVSLYSTLENKFTKTIEKLEGDGAVTGIGAVDKSIFIAKQEGVITLWTGKKSDYFSINLEEKATLNTMVLSKSGKVIATGGECNNLRLWDAQTYQCIFMAKSMGHDELNLPIPTSIRGLAFLPEDDCVTVCATKEGHVLLYDSRTQRKPVMKFHEKKASYTCIAPTFRERQCFVGTTKGYLQMLDLKAPKQLMKTLMGFTGSITGIVCDPAEPVVATTSLDRFLRVHNYETKKLLHKAYLKQNLTKILMKPVVKEEVHEADAVEIPQDIDEEYEEIFKNMETIDEQKKTKHKRKSLADEKGQCKKVKSV